MASTMCKAVGLTNQLKNSDSYLGRIVWVILIIFVKELVLVIIFLIIDVFFIFIILKQMK